MYISCSKNALRSLEKVGESKCQKKENATCNRVDAFL